MSILLHPQMVPAVSEQDNTIAQYRRWLREHQQSEAARTQERLAYREQALATHTLRGKQIAPFAPFQRSLSAYETITTPQKGMLAALLLLLGASFIFLRMETLTALFAAIIGFYLMSLSTSALLILRSQQARDGQDEEGLLDALKDADWPTYTVLCPLSREAVVMPQFLRAIQQIDYPHDKLQVLCLLESDDYETPAALQQAALPPYCQVILVPEGSPRTKPRACNYGLLYATGQYVVIYDAEDIPDPRQLKKAVLAFARSEPTVACVQAQLNFYNPYMNVLTRLFTVEYSLWFDLVLPALQHGRFALPLGGTSNHFKTSVLRALGGWDAYNVTEDADLGMRLAQYGMQTSVLHSTTYEEANARLGNWINQRSRWLKGYMQTFLVQMRSPLRRRTWAQARTTLSLLLLVGGGTATFALSPLLWGMTVVFFLFRPEVTALYHELFPWPVLYAGALCLLGGNVFWVYLAMLSVARRRQYSLVKWALFVPLYWLLLVPVAGGKALWQLVVKPHFWEKTKHGLHLAQGEARYEQVSLDVSRAETHLLPALQATLSTATERMRAVRVGSEHVRVERERARRVWDWWLMVVIGLACVCSVSATWYFFVHHDILLYGDAESHLTIARSVIDSITPGIAQLGGVWLPLPHILMLPFVWNDFLWQTGLAGSIVSMGCYVGTAIYIYLAVQRLTKKRHAACIATCVFLFNPNVLYLQSTPLTEPLCWLTFTATCYYFLAWVQEETSTMLLLTALSTFFATLARYDGWSIFLVLLVLVPVTGLLKRRSLKYIEGTSLFYAGLGGFGIVLWLLWNKLIFGNPLYFQQGPFSSQKQTIGGTVSVLLRYHLLTDVQYYGIDVIETLGIVLVGLATLSLVRFLLLHRISLESIVILVFLTPLAFYIAALFLGQVGLFDTHATFYPTGSIPTSAGASLHLFNSRFGSEMVAPAAILVGLLIPVSFKQGKTRVQIGAWILCSCLLLLIIGQSLWVAHGGIVSLLSDDNPPFCADSYAISVYLSEHYNGGRILQTDYPLHLSEADAGIHFSNVVYEGTVGLWQQALAHPENVVQWVIVGQGDAVSQALAHDKMFAQQFTLVATGASGLRLYHKNGLPPLPTYPVSSYLQGEQQTCTVQKRGA